MQKFDDKTENKFFYTKQYDVMDLITFNYVALEDITSAKFVMELKEKLGLSYIKKIVIDDERNGVKTLYIHAIYHSLREERNTNLILYAYIRSDFYLISTMPDFVFAALDINLR